MIAWVEEDHGVWGIGRRKRYRSSQRRRLLVAVSRWWTLLYLHKVYKYTGEGVRGM